MSVVVLDMMIVQHKKVELALLTTSNLQLSKAKTTARNRCVIGALMKKADDEPLQRKRTALQDDHKVLRKKNSPNDGATELA